MQSDERKGLFTSIQGVLDAPMGDECTVLRQAGLRQPP